MSEPSDSDLEPSDDEVEKSAGPGPAFGLFPFVLFSSLFAIVTGKYAIQVLLMPRQDRAPGQLVEPLVICLIALAATVGFSVRIWVGARGLGMYGVLGQYGAMFRSATFMQKLIVVLVGVAYLLIVVSVVFGEVTRA